VRATGLWTLRLSRLRYIGASAGTPNSTSGIKNPIHLAISSSAGRLPLPSLCSTIRQQKARLRGHRCGQTQLCRILWQCIIEALSAIRLPTRQRKLFSMMSFNSKGISSGYFSPTSMLSVHPIRKHSYTFKRGIIRIFNDITCEGFAFECFWFSSWPEVGGTAATSELSASLIATFHVNRMKIGRVVLCRGVALTTDGR